MGPREYASLVLAVLLVCLARCLIAPRVWSAVGLLVAATLWLPANNGTAEGPVLLSVGQTHGLTLADVVGVGGIAVAAYSLHRLGRSAAAATAIAVAAVVVGFALAFWTSG